MSSIDPPTRRLRLAHVTLGLDMGGQERLLVEFARHADRDRFDLIFVSLSSRGKLADALEDQGWPVLAMNEAPGLRPGMIWRLSRQLRRLKIDVVHTHDDRPLLYGGLASAMARVPTHVHTHHHGYLPSVPRRRIFLIRLAARLADVFVCVSHDSARFLQGQGLPARMLTTVWNGIDLDRYPYRGPRPGGPAVTVARLSPEKDIANLIRAVARLGPTATDFRLEIAGDGPCRAELQALVADLKLTDRVRFLGEVRDIAGLLGQARLFVLPSRTEGISLTILEAMARGLPVLATRVGGNPETVLSGDTGLLVPPCDPSALAQGLVQLWHDTETAALMGLAGRRRAEAFFDIRQMVATYEDLYGGRKLSGRSNTGETSAATEVSLS